MKYIINILMCIAFLASHASARYDREIDLRGKWKFEIGNDSNYANPELDDSEWDAITVPGCWEDNGYPGYDGFAWYRIHIRIPQNILQKYLILKLGRVDDVDRVYINGYYLNGTGSPPPNWQTAYDVKRDYYIPSSILKPNEMNTIAVLVYDHEGCGGILENDIGIYSDRNQMNLLVDLSGFWKFTTGDNKNWAQFDFNDKDWEDYIVPSKWASYGYGDYDGYGWYRKKIVFKKSISANKLILTLGMIDDYDEIYFNGVRIGRTGLFPGEENMNYQNPYYNQRRFYYIPNYLIKWDQENIIAVRVFDVHRDGGIYEGPVGVLTREEYYRYTGQHSY